MADNDILRDTGIGGTSAPTGAGDHSENPWAQPRFVAAAFVVALIVIGAIALVIFPGNNADDDPAPAAGPAAAADPAAADSGSVCGLPDGDQAVPTTAPADTRWELVGTVAAPTAPDTHGPGRSEPVRSCFAHSPIGALYAAVNFVTLGGIPIEEAARAVDDLLAAGPGREAAMRQFADAGDIPEGSTQVVGFSFLNYAPSSTVIDLVTRLSTTEKTALVRSPMTLRWEDGDWKVVASDDGDAYPGMQALPNMTGYTRWAGV